MKAKLDKRTYPTGVKIPAAEMKALSLHRLDFQGEWNYELHPRSSTRALPCLAFKVEHIISIIKTLGGLSTPSLSEARAVVNHH